MTAPTDPTATVTPETTPVTTEEATVPAIGSATGSAVPRPQVTPMPVIPPLADGESFTSWMARTSYLTNTPLGLILNRIGIATGTKASNMPTTYGLTLTTQELSNVATATTTPPDKIAASLLYSYRGGPLNLDRINTRGPNESIASLTRPEWVHVSRSLVCPDCIREDDGVWQLAWRLPWTYLCTRHHTLMVALCDTCDQPTGGFRRDRSARPPFIAHTRNPHTCGNSLPVDPGESRRGAGSRPCDRDITTLHTHHYNNAYALDTQTALNTLLDMGGHNDTWNDLKAIAATVLALGDTTTLAAIAPDHTASLLTNHRLREALTRHEFDTEERSRINHLVQAGGHDFRTGARARFGTATPADPDLMALIAPIAHLILGPLPGEPGNPSGVDAPPAGTDPADLSAADQALQQLAIIARGRRKKLDAMLAFHPTSDHLNQRVEHAAQETGRFHYKTRSITAPNNLEPRHIPAYAWPHITERFTPLLPGSDTASVQKFISINLIKAITHDPWVEAAQRIGHHPDRIPGFTSTMVSRLTANNTQTAFQQELQTVLHELADGTIPLVDYAQRRQQLRGLRTIPIDVFRDIDPAIVVTKERRRNAAIWLWCHLTGGHKWEAPAWPTTPTPNDRENYRRYLTRNADQYAPHLIEYGQTLIDL